MPPPPLASSPPLPTLPMRDPAGHKGAFGTVCVVGGCGASRTRMIGAPALAALAALRAGAGLARLFMPATLIDAGLGLVPEATGFAMPVDESGQLLPHEAAACVDAALNDCTCLLVGPGLGRSPGAAAATLRAVQQHDIHAVIDADGLNALATIPELTRDFHAGAVLTPHPGEFARLAEALSLTDNPVDPARRPHAAAALAQRLGCIVVLKGAGTVISDGQRTNINSTGSVVLATGGTGDVLAGLIAGLIAQFVAPPAEPRPWPMPPRPLPPDRPLDLFQAACLGAHIHGLAAEQWQADHQQAQSGLLATELTDCIPTVMARMRASGPGARVPTRHSEESAG